MQRGVLHVEQRLARVDRDGATLVEILNAKAHGTPDYYGFAETLFQLIGGGLR